MNINWFPGHMAKSLRLIEDSAKLVDVIIYVLDARAPLACVNPALDRVLGKKPALYILNKKDLAEDAGTAAWVKAFSEKGSCIAIDAKSAAWAKPVIQAVMKLAAAKTEKYAEKSINYTVKGMIVGVPNCGKSTIINSLAGGAKAKVGNKPGVTRNKQWLRVSDAFDLMDTPGVLWGNLADQAAARRLAYIGCVKDETFDAAELAQSLINDLHSSGYGGLLIKRYKLAEDVLTQGDGVKCCSQHFTPSPCVAPAVVFEQIARKRGCLLPGGATDRERAAAMILDEFRSGALGKVTLERAVQM